MKFLSRIIFSDSEPEMKARVMSSAFKVLQETLRETRVYSRKSTD